MKQLLKLVLLLLCTTAYYGVYAQKDDVTIEKREHYDPETGMPVVINYKVRVFKYAGQVNFRIYIESIEPDRRYFSYQGKTYSNADLGGNYLEKIDYSNVKGGKVSYTFQKGSNHKSGEYAFASMSLGGFSGDGLSIWTKEFLGEAYYNNLDVSTVSVSTRIIGLNVNNAPVVSRIRELEQNQNKAEKLYQSASSLYYASNPNLSSALQYIEEAESVCDNCKESSRIQSLKRKIETAIADKEKKDAEKEKDKKDTKTNKTEKTAEKTKTEKDRDAAALMYCIGKKTEVEQAIINARNDRHNKEKWDNARALYNNFYNTCGYSNVYLPSEWKAEIDRNIDALTVSEALTSTYDMLTSTPWYYGYGQFIDTGASKGYYHRFGLGIGDSYEEKFFDLKFAINTNLLRLPTRRLNYRFEAEDGTSWSTVKSKNLTKVSIMAISWGPTVTLWPTKFLYLQSSTEINGGFNLTMEAPTPWFALYLSNHNKLGFRMGRVYISGTYGNLWLKMKPSSSSSWAKEKGTLNTYTGVKQGNWVADNFDDGKAVQHGFWIVTLGLNLGN